MKSKTKILIVILMLILFVAIGLGVYFLVDDINNKNTFTSEINNLSETNLNTEVVSTGNYGKVEGLVKNDFKTYVEGANKLVENYKKVEDLKPLNVANYSEDGPEFTNTRENITSIKEENANINSSLRNLVSDDGIAKKIEEAGLNEEFADLYKDVLEKMELRAGVDKIVETDDNFNTFLQSILDVLDYLTNNKDKWFVKDDELKSSDKTFIDEYNSLIQKTNVEF